MTGPGDAGDCFDECGAESSFSLELLATSSTGGRTAALRLRGSVCLGDCCEGCSAEPSFCLELLAMSSMVGRTAAFMLGACLRDCASGVLLPCACAGGALGADLLELIVRLFNNGDGDKAVSALNQFEVLKFREKIEWALLIR